MQDPRITFPPRSIHASLPGHRSIIVRPGLGESWAALEGFPSSGIVDLGCGGIAYV